MDEDPAYGNHTSCNSPVCQQVPWKLTFSFGRTLQQTALAIWEGDDSNKVSAQQDIYHRAKCNRATNMGLYNDEMERRD